MTHWYIVTELHWQWKVSSAMMCDLDQFFMAVGVNLRVERLLIIDSQPLIIWAYSCLFHFTDWQQWHAWIIHIIQFKTKCNVTYWCMKLYVASFFAAVPAAYNVTSCINDIFTWAWLATYKLCIRQIIWILHHPFSRTQIFHYCCHSIIIWDQDIGHILFKSSVLQTSLF